MVSKNRYFRLILDRLTAAVLSKDGERNVITALQDCVKALELNPKNFNAYLTASSCQLSRGNFEEAKSFLKQAQSQFPSDSQREIEILTEQLRILCIEKTLADAKKACSQGRYEAVLTDMDSLTEHVFCLELVWRLKAVALLGTNKFSEIEPVIDEAEKSLICIPPNPSRRCWWRWLLLQKRWWDIEADINLIIQAANRLIIAFNLESITSLDISPALGGPIQERMVYEVLFLIGARKANDQGKAFYHHKRHQEAIECFTKAFELIKTTGAPLHIWFDVCFRRHVVYHEQGRYLEALRDICFAIAVYPLRACSYTKLCLMYAELDHPSGVRAVLKKMKDRCTSETEYVARIEASFDNAKERKKKVFPLNAHKFMGLDEGCGPVEIKKAKSKLALMVHPDKVLSLFSGKIDWMGERQSPAAKERELEIQKELKEQMGHLFRQLNSAAQTLLEKCV